MPKEKTAIEQRYGSTACFYFTYGVRVLSGLTGAGMCVASGLGFDELSRLNSEDEQVKAEALSNQELPSRDAFYMGLQLFYLMIAGLLTILGEVRFEAMKDSVLKPFGFMHAWLGRGLFYILIATFMISVENTTSRVIGGFLFTVGFAQIGISVFVFKGEKKDPNEKSNKEAAQVFGGGAGGQQQSVVNPAADVEFGESPVQASAPPPDDSSSGNPFLVEARN